MNKGFAVCVLLILFAGLSFDCATIIHGTSQDIVADSSPREAEVWVDGTKEGETPVKLDLKRSDSHTVKFVKEGYQDVEAEITNTASAWIIGNIVFGGIIGCGIDFITGGAYDLKPERLDVNLTKLESQEVEPATTAFVTEDEKTAGIEEKTAVALPVEPQVSTEQTAYSDEGTLHELEAILEEGGLVLLSDGSKWEVDPAYHSELLQWPKGCQVSVVRSSHQTYNYILLEAENDLVVRVRFVAFRGTKE